MSQRGEHVLGVDMRAHRDDLTRCIDLVRRVDPEFRRQKIGVIEVLHRITQWRNSDAHGGPIQLSKFAAPLRSALEELLLALPILTDWELLEATKVNLLRTGVVADCLLLAGDGQGERKQFEFGQQSKAHGGSVYLRHKERDEWVEFAPFVLQHNDDLFFFIGLKQGEPVYRCPDDPVQQSKRREEVMAELRARVPGLFVQAPARWSISWSHSFALPQRMGSSTWPSCVFSRVKWLGWTQVWNQRSGGRWLTPRSRGSPRS